MSGEHDPRCTRTDLHSVPRECSRSFSNALDLWKQGKIGDTTVVNGQLWVKTGERITDILMPFDEAALPRASSPEPLVDYYTLGEIEDAFKRAFSGGSPIDYTEFGSVWADLVRELK